MLEAMLRYLPDQATCDGLVPIYFNNYENCYRILHNPSFRAEYADFWLHHREGTLILTHFLPTLLVVLSVASNLGITPLCNLVTFEFSGQPSVRELIKTWMCRLPRRHKYSFATLQLKMLMFLPQRSQSSRIEELWIDTGELVRHALLMNLDREPPASAKISLLELEMRRKLWMTILEYDLAISLMAGKPISTTSDHLEVCLPRNLDDLELSRDMIVLPPSRSQDQWTDGLCQHQLAQSLALRLSAYRYMTDATEQIRYGQVLQYSRKLEAALQDLPSPLKFDYQEDDIENNPGRLFSRMVLDLFIRRVLLNLYTPFALALPKNDVFKEARIGYIQSCLILLCYQDLFDPKFSEVDVPVQEGYWDVFYKIYRFDVLQSCLGLCLEVKRLAKGGTAVANHHERAMGSADSPASPMSKHTLWTKATLIKTIEDSIEPLVRRIGRPGADAKDLLYMTIALNSARTTNQENSQRQKAITEGVQELVAACQHQLQKDGITLARSDAASSVGGSDELFNIGLLDLSALPGHFSNVYYDMTSFPDINLLSQAANSPFGNGQGRNWAPG